ncbi:MAG: hypothetical protein ACREBJ_08160, partial [Nitrosotalea sp.]
METKTQQSIFTIIEYTKTDYESHIEVHENRNINLSLKTIEDWKVVAKLADIKSYGIFEHKINDKGYNT